MEILGNIKRQIEHDFDIDNLAVKKRQSNFVMARKIYGILCRTHTNYSLSTIGQVIERDHATVLHYLKEYKTWKKFPKAFDYEMSRLGEIEVKIMANPYFNYLGKEDNMQHSVMQYIKTKYPDVFAIHVPNEGKRTPFERFKFKHLGGVSGVPDILIFANRGNLSGLAIELKAGSNKPTENQFKCLKSLENANWRAFWSNDYDEVLREIDNYMENV